MRKFLSFILIAVMLASFAMTSAYAAQNLSTATVAEMAGLYTAGASTYDALADGDVCLIFKASTTREFVTYIYDDDSAATEDLDVYVTPDYVSSGVPYAGNARWVKMDYDARYNSRQNLLKNTGWVAASNSDTARGKCTLAYDAGTDVGGGNTPDPGDVATGATSGAVGKVILVTTSTGTWAGDNAAGTIELGACAGRFQDNESVTFTDLEACTVNQPNSAPGPDLLQNGDFSVNTDPPPGWTAVNAAILQTEAGGKVGNCFEINCDGTNNPNAYQAISVTAGKTYYFTCYIKAGTEATYNVIIYDVTNAANIYDSGSKEETAGDWSTSVARYFTAPAGCSNVRIYLFQMATAGAATTLLYDEISCYEVAPCFTAADGLCFDGWTKSNTLDVYQQYNDTTYTKAGSFYSNKFVSSAASDNIYYPAGFHSEPYWYNRYRGETVTAGIWCYASSASNAFIRISDTAGNTDSSYHLGNPGWEWLETTKTISASTTLFRIHLIAATANTVVYFSQPMLCYGSSIGSGNYVPEADRVIWFEKEISSQAFNAKSGANGFSDVAATELILTSDTGGLIGKGAGAVYVSMRGNDSGSAGTDCYFQASNNLTYKTYEFFCSPYNLTNDFTRFAQGFISCNASGNYQYKIEASGGSTFDISFFKYEAVTWR